MAFKKFPWVAVDPLDWAAIATHDKQEQPSAIDSMMKGEVTRGEGE